MKSTTYYQLILDASASMADCYQRTRSSLNEQVDMIKSLALKHDDEDIYMALNDFSDDIQSVWPMTKADKLKKLRQHEYVLRGSTALYDAIGITASELQTKLGRKLAKGNATVVVIILTDGWENASTEFSARAVKALIRSLEATGNWEFRFLGADLDVGEMADDIGLDRDKTRTFSKQDLKAASQYMHDEMDMLIRKKKGLL